MQTGTVVNPVLPIDTSSLKTGTKVVTTAGTAVALGTETGMHELLIQAKRTNAGIIFVGPSTVLNNDTNGIYLSKGEALHLYCNSLAEIYINSTVNGEGVTFLYW